MKSIYRTILAVAGSFLAAQFGGWDAALEMLRWKCWSASWQLTGSQEVFCFLLFLKRVRNLKTERWRAVRDGKGFAEKG